jgi:hypothetical protein
MATIACRKSKAAAANSTDGLASSMGRRVSIILNDNGGVRECVRG